MASELSNIGSDYDTLLRQLKERIRTTQIRAALAVNWELVLLYWHIGSEILIRQQQQGWGAKVIDKLAKDLRKEFPDVNNLTHKGMRLAPDCLTEVGKRQYQWDLWRRVESHEKLELPHNSYLR